MYLLLEYLTVRGAFFGHFPQFQKYSFDSITDSDVKIFQFQNSTRRCDNDWGILAIDDTHYKKNFRKENETGLFVDLYTYTHANCRDVCIFLYKEAGISLLAFLA